MHVDLTRPSLKLPGVEAPAGRQPQIDAAVALQILGCPRQALPLEVAWRRHDRHPEVRAHAHSDHVLRDLFTQPDSGVEVLRNNVAETVVEGQLDPDVGVLRKKALQPRQHHPLRGMFGAGDSDGTCRRFAQRRQRIDFGIDPLEGGTQGSQQPLPRLGRRHAPGGPAEKP